MERGADVTMQTTFPITALQAQAAANLFLSEHLPDRFTADQAQFNPQGGCWHVPVILAYPGIGALGGVGEIWVATQEAAVIFHTPVEEMWARAQHLYDAHRDAIEAAFL
jgi:hypothetical protein